MKPRFRYLTVVPALVLVLGVVLYPFGYLIWMVFHRISLLAMSEPKFIGLGNLAKVLSDADLATTFRNTALFVGESVIMNLLLGFLLALLVNRMRAGKLLFRSIFLLPMMIAPLAASVIWKLLYDPSQGAFNRILISLGLNGPDWLGGYHLALQSTIAVDVWLGVPFVFIVLLGGLESLPVEPFESAKIDGASAWQTVRRITIPMMRPLLLIAVTFRIVWSFRNFGVVYGLTQGGPAGASETMIFRVWRVAFSDLELGYAATIALLMAALILCITVLFVIGLSRQSTTS